RCEEVREEQQEGRPCRRHVVIEDAEDLADGVLFPRVRGEYVDGRRRHGGVQSEREQRRGDDRSDDECRLIHSACKTVSKSNRQTVVNTTSYTASRLNPIFGDSPT